MAVNPQLLLAAFRAHMEPMKDKIRPASARPWVLCCSKLREPGQDGPKWSIPKFGILPSQFLHLAQNAFSVDQALRVLLDVCIAGKSYENTPNPQGLTKEQMAVVKQMVADELARADGKLSDKIAKEVEERATSRFNDLVRQNQEIPGAKEELSKWASKRGRDTRAGKLRTEINTALAKKRAKEMGMEIPAKLSGGWCLKVARHWISYEKEKMVDSAIRERAAQEQQTDAEVKSPPIGS